MIGAGQAGLAIAWHLRQARARFPVLEAAAELGHTWRTRWDSLTLFSPSQYDGLPGLAFPAAPDTYPTKDQVADYLTDYATAFDLPILLNSAVTGLTHDDGRFTARTPQGAVHARQVVVATGAFQAPVLPEVARGFDPSVTQLHGARYRNPHRITPGRVLVVGAGNSGLQIARELADTHEVHLAVGSSPARVPQRMLGKDLFWWLTGTGAMRAPADSRLGRRLKARGDLVIGATHRELRRAGVDFHPAWSTRREPSPATPTRPLRRWTPWCGPPACARTTPGFTSPPCTPTTGPTTQAGSPRCPACISSACRGSAPGDPPCWDSSSTTPPGWPTPS